MLKKIIRIKLEMVLQQQLQVSNNNNNSNINLNIYTGLLHQFYKITAINVGPTI